MADKGKNPQERYYAHLRMVKRILKPLPRRAMLHKYPFIKWFAKGARKCPYLWSFRVHEVVLAILIGSIIAFTPLYGFHIPLAFLLALVLRANLSITVALQLIANNPFTALPLLAFDYELGFHIFKYFNILPEGLNSGSAKACIDHLCSTHSVVQMFSKGADIFWMMLVGGVISGFVFSLIVILLYRFLAWYLHHRYGKIKQEYIDYKKTFSY